MKKKIAIVNQRYGAEINGGSEYYTKKLAEHLQEYYNIEVLTTTALDYDTWAPYYQEGKQMLDGVTVRRFPVKKKRNIPLFLIVNKLLRIAPVFWKILEPLWVKAQGPYCPDLIEYIKANEDSYDVFIFVTYLYYTSVAGISQVREKAILVPTAHDEYCIYLHMYREMFTQIKGIVYLTKEEKSFVEQLFHNESIPQVVAGSGLDVPQFPDAEGFRKKYGIVGEYVIYVGRVDTSKKCDVLFDFFSLYQLNHQGGLTLVVLGKLMMKKPVNSDIVCLGFIDEADKYGAIAGARALIMPSEHESLSLAVLEALSLGTPVIVNGACKVLKAHCDKSGAGLSYCGYKQFEECLSTLQNQPEVYKRMCESGGRYVAEHYTWDRTVKKYEKLIEI